MCARDGRQAGSLKGNELVSYHQAAASFQRSLGEFLVLTGTDMLFPPFPSPPFLVSLPISFSPLLFFLPFISLPICQSSIFPPTLSLLLPPPPLTSSSSAGDRSPQSSPLGGPTSSTTGPLLYIPANLKLSMPPCLEWQA